MLIQLKRTEEAMTQLTQLVEDEASKSKSWKADAMDSIADIHTTLRQYDEAITTLKQRIETYGENEDVLFRLAKLYDRTEQFGLAVATAKKLLQQHPDYHNRAVVEKLLKDKPY